MSDKTLHLDDVDVTPFLKKVTIFSSGGPFLDGFVLAVIGVAMPLIQRDLELTTQWSAALGVAALVGIFLGTSIGGFVTDLVGRKKMFIIDVIAIGVCSVGCALATGPLQLFIWRFLVGIAIGADYPIATSLVAEFTPRRYRAMSMGFIALVWYLGANVAYLVGYFLLDTPNGWRWMLASSIVACAIILAGRWNIPESPRWLSRKGRVEEARVIVHNLFGADVELEGEEPVQTKYSKLFKPVYLKRVIFIGTIWLCQAIPMFAIYTFGPSIISAFGLDGRQAILGEVVIGTFFLIGCIPAMYLAESLGRRPLLIGCFVAMTLSLGVLGVVDPQHVAIVVVCFAIYALFSGGPGNLQWLYPNELFPTDVRASALGLAMALSRIGTVIALYVLPGFMEAYGTKSTMMAGALISLLGLVVSVFMAPETKGLPLSVTSSAEFTGRK